MLKRIFGRPGAAAPRGDDAPAAPQDEAVDLDALGLRLARSPREEDEAKRPRAAAQCAQLSPASGALGAAGRVAFHRPDASRHPVEGARHAIAASLQSQARSRPPQAEDVAAHFFDIITSGDLREAAASSLADALGEHSADYKLLSEATDILVVLLASVAEAGQDSKSAFAERVLDVLNLSCRRVRARAELDPQAQDQVCGSVAYLCIRLARTHNDYGRGLGLAREIALGLEPGSQVRRLLEELTAPH